MGCKLYGSRCKHPPRCEIVHHQHHVILIIVIIIVIIIVNIIVMCLESYEIIYWGFKKNAQQSL